MPGTSILVRACKLADPSDPDSSPKFKWYTIQSRDDGLDTFFEPQAKEVLWDLPGKKLQLAEPNELFRHLPKEQPQPQPHPPPDLLESSYALVGSTLYVLGGRGNTKETRKRVCNAVWAIDTLYPEYGWSIRPPLPFCFATATATVVAGNFIYLFSGKEGIVYDTKQWIEEWNQFGKGFIVTVPCEKTELKDSFYAAVVWSVDRFGLALFTSSTVYIHDPHLNTWSVSFADLPQVPVNNSFYRHAATLGSTLFLSYHRPDSPAHIYAIDMLDGMKCLFDTELPDVLTKEDPSRINFFALNDYEFCYLWWDKLADYKMKLFMATFRPGSCASYYLVQEFELEADHISTCLPIASLDSSILSEEISGTEEEITGSNDEFMQEDPPVILGEDWSIKLINSLLSKAKKRLLKQNQLLENTSVSKLLGEGEGEDDAMRRANWKLFHDIEELREKNKQF